MPPGSYIFWRIGMLSPLYWWALTLSICLGVLMLWYAVTVHFVLCSTAQQTWCSQCVNQLAELATADESVSPVSIVSSD